MPEKKDPCQQIIQFAIRNPEFSNQYQAAGPLIRSKRYEKKLSRSKLAEKMGIKLGLLAAIENGYGPRELANEILKYLLELDPKE